MQVVDVDQQQQQYLFRSHCRSVVPQQQQQLHRRHYWVITQDVMSNLRLVSQQQRPQPPILKTPTRLQSHSALEH